MNFPKGDFSIKIIITGDYKAGKTSFIKKFVENQFQEEYNATVGLSISKKKINIREHTKIKLNIWDSGGLTSQISPYKEKFYNHVDGAFIIIDKTHHYNLKSFEKCFEKWYNEINKSVVRSIPIIMIGTKKDILINDFINEDDIKKIAEKKEVRYIYVSSKTGENINEAFLELSYQIIDLIINQEIYQTRGKYKKYVIKPEEAKALEDLEKIILRKPINRFNLSLQYDLNKIKNVGFPYLFNIDDNSFGFNVQNGRVVGLGLFNCGLTTLPESFSNLKSLKNLTLKCNPFKKLPESIMKLISLEKLDLSLTNLTTLSDSFGNLKALKELHLENNWLTQLPESFGNLDSLQILHLENNPFNSIPQSFCNLEALEELYLEAAPFEPRGYLMKLPKNFGNLKSLQLLDLSSHKLKILPESFGNLKSLKSLDLFNNRFKTLPNYIGNLKALEAINLERNLIQLFPKTLGNLSNLRSVNLKNNIITPKEASKRFKAFAFKSIGDDYNRWIKIAGSIENHDDQMYLIRSDLKEKMMIKNIITPLIYACFIAFIGLLTFLTTDIASLRPNITIIWVLFLGALIINLLIGTSIISTISSYFKFSVSKFGMMVQRNVLKIFDVLVAILLVWAIRSAVKKGISIELIPAVNFLFEFAIPVWIINIFVLLGYNIDLTFLENLDLFLGHFYLKLFSTSLVFWSLYRNGVSYIKKTAFDEKENKNVWPFLILGLFGAFAFAIMNYSSLKPLLSIGYSFGVIIGACLFMWEKNKYNKIIFYSYLILICSGILIVWLLSLWNLIISLIFSIIFVLMFFIIRYYSHKKTIWSQI